MNRRLATGLVLGILTIALLLTVAANWLNNRFNGSTTPVFDGPIATTTTTKYTTRPIKRDELKDSILPVPLPIEATNIQFAEYEEYAAYEQFVRLEAPPEVCRAYAKALLDDHNRRNPGRPVPANLKPVESPGSHKAVSHEIPTPWFTPELIRQGLEAGELGSHQPRIWVDPEKGILYYQYTD